MAAAPEQGSIRSAVADRIATVLISQPSRRNALTRAMWADLGQTLLRLEADPDVGVIILAGDGEHFSAGADITDLPADPDETFAMHAPVEERLAGLSKPTIAAIRGSCIAGGCELAIATDLRFAAPDSRFGITATGLGIVYPAASTARLVDLVGSGQARRMLLGGELFDAAWAERHGLVHEVVASPLERAREYATRLLGRSLAAIAATKEHLAAPTGAGQPDREAQIRADYAEGLAAFRHGRRAPTFGAGGRLRADTLQG